MDAERDGEQSQKLEQANHPSTGEDQGTANDPTGKGLQMLSGCKRLQRSQLLKFALTYDLFRYQNVGLHYVTVSSYRASGDYALRAS